MTPARRFAAARTALLPIAGALFAFLFSATDSRAQGSAGTCDDAAEPRGPALADRAVEGRAAARHVRGGEAARGRAFADRARRQRRDHVAHAARRAAVFLARRGQVAGRRDMASQARARPCAGRMQHDHARNRRARRRAASAERSGGQRLAAARHLEPRHRKPVLGLDREAVRRPAGRGSVVAGAA